MVSASDLGSDSACGENGHAGDIDDEGGNEERNLQGRIIEEEVFSGTSAWLARNPLVAICGSPRVSR